MSLKANLTQAKRNKKDEFYTQLKDIENELRHYKDHFKGKTVYCNADDPRVSNFFHYFSYNFEHLGLKKLITTCYKNQEMDLFSMHDYESAIALVYEGEKDNGRVPTVENIGVIELRGDGDFRSPEAIEFLKEADIVVTNPPFSLFREYVAQLIEYDKDFIIVGHQNAITYKETFPLLKDNKIIGFAYCYTLLRPDGKTMFYLHSIGMLPNYQDKGYGSKLLSFIKEYSKEIGCSEMFLITDKGNPRACHVYEKLGGKNDYKDEIVYVYDYEKGDK